MSINIGSGEGNIGSGQRWHYHGAVIPLLLKSREVFVRRWSCRVLTLVAILIPFFTTAIAAELDGIHLPDAVHIEGKTLVLNGIGQRRYSFLRVPIYVAGLYVQHPSTSANAILESSEVKLLTIKFQHDVSAADARTAWRNGFDANCVAPCHLDPDAVSRFLAAIPAMHAGDVYTILFTPGGARVDAGTRPLGEIRLPDFAQAMLATFLGPRPASLPVKEALLRGHA
jgi:Chalcone isomerase-like